MPRGKAKPGEEANAGLVVPVKLTPGQVDYCRQSIGIAKATYNWHVAAFRNGLAVDLWLTPAELKKKFNVVKNLPTPPEGFFQHIKDVPKFVSDGGALDYKAAYDRWRKDAKKSPGVKKAGRPTYHKKSWGGGAFMACYDQKRIHRESEKRIKLPGLGSVKLGRKIPAFVGLIKEVRVKLENGRWYASLKYVHAPIPAESKSHAAGGLDVGIKYLAVESDGTIWENPKAYYKAEKRLRRWQRAQARRVKFSRGWYEAKRRIDACHRQIKNIRSNVHHQLSRAVVKKYEALGVESLNVAGMIKAGLQSKSLADAGIGGLLTKVKYKSDWYGTRMVEADRFYTSSKTCSDCGVVNGDLGRQDTWYCPNCGVKHQRDFNAARNLQQMAEKELGLIRPDVTPPEGKALAVSLRAAGETVLVEGGTVNARRYLLSLSRGCARA